MNAVAANASITGASKTKITYDSKGLVLSGSDATTSDIAEVTDKKYVTDAEKLILGNTSGTNTGDQVLPTLVSLNAVAANTSITGASKTKITYDSKGLVLSGSDATTADIAEVTDKKYVTDAEKVILGNTTGTNTGDKTILELGGVDLTTDQTIDGNKTFTAPINATLATPSDFRLKREIKPILGGIETLMQLNPVSYEKKSSLASSDYSIKENGFIAQELKKVLPILVNEGKGPDKLLSVNYISIIPILTKAIQEQQKTIEGQQKQIDELKILVEKLINKK